MKKRRTKRNRRAVGLARLLYRQNQLFDEIAKSAETTARLLQKFNDDLAVLSEMSVRENSPCGNSEELEIIVGEISDAGLCSRSRGENGKYPAYCSLPQFLEKLQLSGFNRKDITPEFVYRTFEFRRNPNKESIRKSYSQIFPKNGTKTA